MNKAFSFMAGALCGALIGGVTALLLTPASGAELKESALERWEMAKQEAAQAMEETRIQLENEYRQNIGDSG
jgi:gas vesicle protein